MRTGFLDKYIIYGLYPTIEILLTYFFKNRKRKALPLLENGMLNRVSPETVSDAALERITDAYLKAKEAQAGIPDVYKVGKLWQKTLDTQYGELQSTLSRRDYPAMRDILEGFSRQRFAASQGGGVDFLNSRTHPFYKYLFVNTWFEYYELYRESEPSPYSLHYPQVGNPAGLYQAGQIIPIEAMNFICCAETVKGLLDGVPNPVVCEIGGGNGGFAYYLTADSDVIYIDLDIPEMLVIASFFLMASLPQKEYHLYGEPESSACGVISLLPNFAIKDMGARSVDLFYNQRSFPEMDKAAVQEYLMEIERSCRGYFMHINHSIPDGRNMPANQIIPNASLFKKVFSHPWGFTRLEEKWHHKGGREMVYLYERRNDK